ncbi:MAG: alanine racemase [Acidobacteriaceae bacterium]|nr:alanine racemase [Acidobacteriaceae bacterium]
MKSWIEISAANLASNVTAIREVSGAEVLAVIKADGYGHGAASVAPLLAQAGVRWMGVTDVEEGRVVREVVGPAIDLLVMNVIELADAAEVVRWRLTPSVWTSKHVAALDAAANEAGAKDIAVHVEVDTGMSRQGAAPGEGLVAVLEAIKRSKHVRCDGVFTHLAESEVAASVVTADQRARFGEALQQVREAGLTPHWLHMGNSSAVDEGSTMPWIHEQAKSFGSRVIVRPGYATYGHCLPVVNGTGKLVQKLKPAMEWKTCVIGLRSIAPGTTVGYGATFAAGHEMQLALLPVGYADGFRRAASSGLGNGWVMIAGRRAPVVGRVSMNLLVVDVTGHNGVALGDDATLLGEGVSAEDHGVWANTIGYDILCGMRGHMVVR